MRVLSTIILCALATAQVASSAETETRDTAWPRDLASDAVTADFHRTLVAAEGGDPKAHLLIGLTYVFGEFRDGSKVDQNYQTAEKWLRRSAMAGNSYAQWYLGGMYRQGIGVETNPAEAGKWFLAAAKQGNVKARVNLATLFLEGTGMGRDYDKAYAWASLAAFCGNENANRVVQHALPHVSDRERADALAAEYFKDYGTNDVYGDACVGADTSKH